MILHSPAFPADQPQTPWDVVLRDDAKVGASLNVTEDMTAVLMPEADTSHFEGLISRLVEPGEHLHASFSVEQNITLLLNLMAREVYNMVWLVNEAFKVPWC